MRIKAIHGPRMPKVGPRGGDAVRIRLPPNIEPILKEGISYADFTQLIRLETEFREHVAERGLQTEDDIRNKKRIRKHHVRILTREEEEKIFTTYVKAKGLHAAAKEEMSHASDGEGKAARAEMERLQHIMKTIKSIAVLANQGLVYSMAGKVWRKRRLEHLGIRDLVQEGNIAILEKAVDRFDPTKGYRFATYVTWWIRQAMNRSIANKEDVAGVRVPVNIHERLSCLERFRREEIARTGVRPSDERTMRATGIDPKEFDGIRQWRMSTDQMFDGDEGEMRFELPDPNPVCAEQSLMEDDRRRLVGTVFRMLTQRELDVIRMRFGFDDEPERTLQEIGDIFNLTRERVRQIESKALDKLRKRCNMQLDGALI
ncbi:MAG: sigma-70 family RNA polymerase sigma factor [Candidatus Micrarchaeota archaeon]